MRANSLYAKGSGRGQAGKSSMDDDKSQGRGKGSWIAKPVAGGAPQEPNQAAEEQPEEDTQEGQPEEEDTGCNGTCTVLMRTPADQPVRRCGRQCGRRGGHSGGPARCMCRGHLDTQAPSPPSEEEEECSMTRLERTLQVRE